MTRDEQEALAAWSSWGAVPDVFDEGKPEWSAEREQLKSVLNDEEYAAARSTIRNAHYTDPALITAMWQSLSDLGLESGKVIEPGSGSGNFIGAAPAGMAVTGVEVDPITSSIARHLYPDADIRTESFSHTRVRPGSYDAAIGNVPFGRDRLMDETWNPGQRFNLHEHFIRKSLGGLHDGGVMAVVTSASTSDRRNPVLRAEVAAEADLLGAVRLPNGAHRRTAGTDVATDVLLLRKRLPGEEPTQATIDWQTSTPLTFEDVSGGESEQYLNTYYQRNPENVLGELGVSGQWGNLAIVADDLDAVPGQLRARLEAMTAEAVAGDRGYVPLSVAAEAARDERAAQETSLTPGTVVEEEGQFQQVTADGYLEPIKVPQNAAVEVRSLMGLRDKMTALMRDQTETIADTETSVSLRDDAHAAWSGHVERYGPVNRFQTKWVTVTQENEETGEKEKVREPRRDAPRATKIMRADPSFSLVIAAEKFNDETQTATPSDILTKRTVTVERPLLGAETAEEALTLAINATGQADLEQVAVRLGTDVETARRELGTLVFDDPEDSSSIITRAEYLSGHIRNKIDAARAAAEADPEGPWQTNIDALEAVVPQDVPLEEIEATIGAVWIPATAHEQFLRELSDDDYAQVIHPGAGFWEVKPGSGGRQSVAATSEWGTEDRPAHDLFRSLLRGSTIEVRRNISDSEGTKQSVLDPEATEAAREKAEAITERFSEWVWEDPDRANRLHADYNRRFNSYVARDYSVEGARLELPGLVEDFIPHEHQRTAVARMVAEPAVGLFHQVGAGKTAAMVMGVTEMKRRGLVSKPMITVPGHMLEQFTREWKQLYPNARLLTADSDDIAIKKGDLSARRAFVAKAAMNDWDGVLMTHSAFERIGVRDSTLKAYTDRQLEELREALSRAHEVEGGEGRTRTQKQIQDAIARAEARLESKLAGADEGGLTFEDTGVDYAAIDEGHLFKNLATTSNIPGAGIAGSGRANDLDMKLSYLRETYGERVVTMATGTPIANSITEAHVMMRYLRPDILEDTGVRHFDDWANTFGELVTRFERDAAGNLKQKQRFAKFKNVPEMLGGWQQFADVKMTEDLTYLKRPELRMNEDGERASRYEIIPESNAHAEFMVDLEKRLKDLEGTRPEKGADNHLTVYGDGRKAALDPRLVGLETDELVKLDTVASNVAEIWAENRENIYPLHDKTDEASANPGALQIVFCDLGTPKDNEWNAYDQLKDSLVERYGMDPNRVRFIHEAKDAEEKAALFKEAREGGVDVLIGSSERMGTGANIQLRAVALHHVDCPWRPAELTQREGRILRQGNQNSEVDVIRYATENSFDSTAWDIISRKSFAVQQVMRGQIDVRELEDPGDMALDAQQLMAASSGNPLLLEKVELETEVNKLDRRRRGHDRAQFALRGRHETAEREAAYVEDRLPKIQQLIGAATETKGDKFTATVNGRLYDDRGEASAALVGAITAKVPNPHMPWIPPFEARDIVTVGGHSFSLHSSGGERGKAEVRLEMDGTDVPGTSVAIAWRDLLKEPQPQAALMVENRVTGLSAVAEKLTERAEAAVKELESTDALIGKPFKFADELTEAKAKLNEVVARITSEQAPAEETADERPAPAATDGAPQPERDSYAQSVSARERLFGASTTSKSPTGDREYQQRQRAQQTSSADRHTEVER